MKRPVCPLCTSRDPSRLAVIDSKNYWRCWVCSLTFLSPEHHLDSDSEHSRYKTHRNSPQDLGYIKFLSRLTDYLVPRLSRGAKGLDYGSGPGPTLSVMLEGKGFPMEIYDPFFSPDASVLKDQYEFVTCTETAEHFHQPANDFERLDRLLKKGGLLGVMTEMLEPEASFPDWYYHRDPTHVSFYQRSTMEWIANRFRWKAEVPHRNVTLFFKS